MAEVLCYLFLASLANGLTLEPLVYGDTVYRGLPSHRHVVKTRPRGTSSALLFVMGKMEGR